MASLGHNELTHFDITSSKIRITKFDNFSLIFLVNNDFKGHSMDQMPVVKMPAKILWNIVAFQELRDQICGSWVHLGKQAHYYQLSI